ncbi:MAG: phosphate ABC transporter substrate-binding protein PstS [bacterium]|nr:phosphate ABC transporter substrate-binding protein PstS [bacterium]
MLRQAFTRRGALSLAAGFVATAVAAAGVLPALAATQLTGAGSSFDYPLFSKAFYEYSQQHGDVTVNYQSIGSGGGIRQFTAKTVDFGASDVPLNQEELKRAEAAGGAVLQIPIALGGVAVTYNVPGIGNGLRLSGTVIADIYLGKIAKWNDAAIAKLNPSLKLPDTQIVVVHRSDGSGTSYIFTDYLSAVSREWKSKVGVGKSVQWPAQNSVGGKGNEGVSGQIGQTPGAIGYVELAYALQNKMTYAQVGNRSGKFVYPTIETVRAAAATKPAVNPNDFSIVDRPGASSYPIAGYSWVMLFAKPADSARGKLVKAVLEWTATEGQRIAQTLYYVPLPANVQQEAQRVLGQMHV